MIEKILTLVQEELKRSDEKQGKMVGKVGGLNVIYGDEVFEGCLSVCGHKAKAHCVVLRGG